MQYQNLYLHASNSTGYASANLKVLSVEYSLIKNVPLDFCGSWVTPNEYNKNECPYSGNYHFSLPYTLPWDDQDITTWLATGWQGTTDLVVYNDTSSSAELLASCRFHWRTYVTESQEEGWHTMPSATQAAIILASILAVMSLCCFYLTCCRRRRTYDKALLDVIETTPAPAEEEGEATSSFRRMTDRDSGTLSSKAERIHRINVNMKDPDWA